jgi:hypothetical protein
MTIPVIPGHRGHTHLARPDGERERLRQTFDQAAGRYDRVRPDWERVYPAEEYIELLGTFSGHLAMAAGR